MRPRRDRRTAVPTGAAATGPSELCGAGAGASEAVGRVGDPVGRLLLGALGGAVGGEEGLVRLRLLALGDGPLRGCAGRPRGFPRRAPVRCRGNGKPDVVRLGPKGAQHVTFSRAGKAARYSRALSSSPPGTKVTYMTAGTKPPETLMSII